MLHWYVMRDRVEELVREVLSPLVEADGGKLHLIEAGPDRVVLHLSGACTGCPGIHYTRGHVIVPLLRSALGSQIEVIVENSGSATTSNLQAAQ